MPWPISHLSPPPPSPVKYKVRLAGSETVIAESPEGGVEFVLAKPGPEIIRGIPLSVKSMKKGEVALVKLKPECE